MNIDRKNIAPIPKARSIKSWQSITINENGEPLVDVTSFATDKIITAPKYYQRKIPGSMPICYVRKSVGIRLAQVAHNLPDGFKLIIFDAWRPTEVQEFIYYEFLENLRKEHPNWTNQELLTHTQIYVSLPNTDPVCPSPHLTGGAVDLSIIDDKGILLDMGTEFDAFTDTARTNYFEENLTESQKTQRDNRRFLYNLMINQGFTNYPEEWWHFDYGNQFWAILINSQAKYSVIELSK